MSSSTLRITAGRGPAECMRAVALVAREIGREAGEAGLSVSCTLPAEREAAPSAAVVIGGDGHEAFAASWQGTVQWTARSAARGRHSRKNWFVGVSRSPPLPEPPALDEAEVRFEAMRAGGPGGQHQNVTDSAVRAVHLPTGIAAVARGERSQHRNRKAALERLAAALAAMHEEEAAAAMRRSWKEVIEVERGSPTRRYEGEEMRRC